MMADASKGCVTVVGAGFMGTVIASLYARYGYKVRLTDCVPRSLAAFRERSRPIAASLVDGAPAADKLLASVETQSDLDAAVQDSFFVHEAINENLAAKQDLFFTLDRICKPDVVLATNTSSLRLTDVFSRVRHR